MTITVNRRLLIFIDALIVTQFHHRIDDHFLVIILTRLILPVLVDHTRINRHSFLAQSVHPLFISLTDSVLTTRGNAKHENDIRSRAIGETKRRNGIQPSCVVQIEGVNVRVRE